jgi:hypothetical protein
MDDPSAEPLDEGWIPRDRPGRHRLETQQEQYVGDSIDERVDQEEPEVWESDLAAPVGREPDRVGRLSAGIPDRVGRSAASVYAADEGLAGGAASAEEAAVHLIEDE